VIAHLDCSTGISGDKFLGALLDAGLEEVDLRAALARLGVPESALRVERVRTHGISAVSVWLEAVAGTEEQPLRHLADVCEIIERAGLTQRVTRRAIGVFELLAQAEARVHGTTADEVHFHEVGALDAIVDIVGVALGLDALAIESLTATPPALGGGTVTASHGLLPVPAPATAELLLGVPTEAGVLGADAGELTTPTGAALLVAFADRFGCMPPMTASAVGYGAGTRDIGAPNIARIVIGEPLAEERHAAGRQTPKPAGSLTAEDVCVLEANIDHLTPEQIAFCAEELLGEGALDVWQTPIVMKKGRAAVALSLMCAPEEGNRLATRMHALTDSLGVRRSDIRRTVLPREVRTVETRYGPVRVKVAEVDGARVARPEYEDVARVARETGRPIAEVARALEAEVAEALGLD
jgi:uncharacterized protein (TIGR00299 family) protein